MKAPPTIPDAKPEAPPNVWANVLGPAYATDNSASLLDAFRRGRDQAAAQVILTAEIRAKERADLEASYLPRPLTPDEERLRDEQAAYSRRWRHALGLSVNAGASPPGLPEVPDNAP